MSLISVIETTHGRQIDRRAQDFGDHEGMRETKIVRWMIQFDEEHQLASKILREIKYYSILNIRSMVRELVGLIYLRYQTVARNRILFVPIGEPYEGSAIIARALRDEIGEGNIFHMTDLVDLDQNTFDVVLFLDDFSGTGSQLDDWWKINEALIRPLGVEFSICLLVLNYTARPIIEKFSDIICIDELNEMNNVISEDSVRFTPEEKDKIRHFCQITGCDPEDQNGFGDCGLLLAFKHGCPDNSLPILWHPAEDWEPLFKKSAL